MFKIAMIGAGNIAAHHIRAWRQTGRAEVVGVCRRDTEKAKSFAGEMETDWTTDYNDFLKNSDVDLVDIVLPSGLHAEIGREAAAAGKHVLVEKPIDVTLEKADALIHACKQHNVTLGVVSQYRFMNGMQSVYEVLESGKLGRLIQGDAYIKWFRPQSYYDSGAWRGTWALDGGGPFMNQGIHFIDLLLSVMGDVKQVQGNVKTVAHDIEVEDHGIAMLEFTNGATGIIEASTSTFPGLPARLDVHGAEGTVVLEGEDLVFKHIKDEEPYRKTETGAGGASNPLDIDVTPFVRQFEDVMDAVENKRMPVVSGAAARKPLELILAIYESSKRGEPVVLNS